MTSHARGTFEIDLRPPADPELSGRVGRFEFDKTFIGGVEGTSSGLMLSAGDPTAGAAGYVALEFVTGGQVDEAVGSFALQQFGQMIDGTQKLLYEIVPGGSGTGELKGIAGTLELEVVDGLHRYDLEYSLHD